MIKAVLSAGYKWKAQRHFKLNSPLGLQFVVHGACAKRPVQEAGYGGAESALTALIFI